MKRIYSKAAAIFTSALAGTLLFSGLASAHVTVKPSASKPEAYETYTIKIPVEKEIATTKVAIKIPANVDFKNYQPEPGWKVETTKDNAGKVTAVTWTAEGAGIEPGQFQQFNFVAKNPAKDTSIAWDAYQYYKDGSVVEWTGDGGENPHSVTTISESAEGAAAADSGHDDHHAAGGDSTSGGTSGTAGNTDTTSSAGNEAATGQAAASTSTDNSGSSTAQTISIVLSAAALLVSLAALWISILFVRRIKR
ncbi:YcnI family protein [Paenibacillus sp. J22TS3]|uniref:YcnI family copper-binding membrane protein n=1 Tax=Paenibacillus sp. J22TS3 TaxID=2807192 RepID=UPI001B1FB6F8|nr:YcnI family protein [Paenibacillus sp. J22TS3]GIP23472.1 hypothetical protein J22TS3_37470 [Paenibacillus sp. J22TS3]